LGIACGHPQIWGQFSAKSAIFAPYVEKPGKSQRPLKNGVEENRYCGIIDAGKS